MTTSYGRDVGDGMPPWASTQRDRCYSRKFRATFCGAFPVQAVIWHNVTEALELLLWVSLLLKLWKLRQRQLQELLCREQLCLILGYKLLCCSLQSCLWTHFTVFRISQWNNEMDYSIALQSYIKIRCASYFKLISTAMSPVVMLCTLYWSNQWLCSSLYHSHELSI